MDHPAKMRPVKRGDIPDGWHFETFLGDQKFEYTQNGYERCKTSGTKHIMQVDLRFWKASGNESD